MLRYFFLGLLFTCMVSTAQAQTTVTFNVNLKPLMQDSSFVPGQDIIRITGNLYPLDIKTYQLLDQSPADSVYTTEINFSRRHNNQSLNYNFEIVKPEEILKEVNSRSLILSGGKIELPPALFNSFAM